MFLDQNHSAMSPCTVTNIRFSTNMLASAGRLAGETVTKSIGGRIYFKADVLRFFVMPLQVVIAARILYMHK